MNTLITILLLAAIIAVIGCANLFSRRGITWLANIAEGTHEASITKLTDAAITARHLLFKVGTDASHIAVSGAAEAPLGTVDDEASAAEEAVAVQLLGKGSTKRMVASEAIDAGELVYTAANGKVQAPPTAAGTYYLVGQAISAAGADGAIIEVRDIAPVKVVIGAAVALTSTNGVAGAAGADLPGLAAEAEKIGDDVRALHAALVAAGVIAAA